MAGQPGCFALDRRDASWSAAGDPLARLAAAVDVELFRGALDAALGPGQGRPAALRSGADVQGPGATDALYARTTRPSTSSGTGSRSWAASGLAMEDRVPAGKTIWLFREQLTK